MSQKTKRDYFELVSQAFEPKILSQIDNILLYTDHAAIDSIPYVQVWPVKGKPIRQVVIIPGFLSSVDHWRAFAGALAELQIASVVIGQRFLHRSVRHPTLAHAKDIKRVLDRVRAATDFTPDTIIAHSYGFIKSDAFITTYSSEPGMEWLRDVTLVGLTPAGLIGKSSIVEQAIRFWRTVTVEHIPGKQELPDINGNLQRISIRTFLDDPLVSIAEAFHVSRHTTNLDALIERVARIEIIGFMGDRFITIDRLDRTLKTYEFSETSALDPNTAINLHIPKRMAHLNHNSPVFNPKLTAKLVTDLLG